MLLLLMNQYGLLEQERQLHQIKLKKYMHLLEDG